MDGTVKTFLEILRAGLNGERATIADEISPEEWQQLFRLAGIHNVLPLFYEAAYGSPSLVEERQLLSAVKHQVRQLVLLQTQRTMEFLALNDRMQAAGIRPLVVKGIVCRNLYQKPDHRPSGDEDVLIRPEDFRESHKILTEFGMETTMPQETISEAYEIPYRKPGSPLYIELHKHLFPPESQAYGDLNRFFEGVFDRAVEMEIQGEKVYSLGHTDHLFYLICHAFKHFLHSGFGIRQVCDIALYANAYGAGVDWLQMLEHCKAIHAERFAAAIFAIGSKYLVFDPEQAQYPRAWRDIRVDEMPMLEDLLSGGLYGAANMSRKHSSNITLDAVAARKKGKKTGHAFVASLFPRADKLEGRYPYLRKHPYLVPVAWCSRLWAYAREADGTRENSPAQALKIGSQRVELMRQYGILE